MLQADPDAEVCEEVRVVLVRRFKEAREAGLTRLEARLFAESDIDVGKLRKLVDLGATGKEIARILI